MNTRMENIQRVRTSSCVTARICCLLTIASLLPLSGCILAGLSSAIGANIEKQKQIEVLAKYRGLENKSVAVLAHSDQRTAYEFPMAIPNIVGPINVG